MRRFAAGGGDELAAASCRGLRLRLRLRLRLSSPNRGSWEEVRLVTLGARRRSGGQGAETREEDPRGGGSEVALGGAEEPRGSLFWETGTAWEGVGLTISESLLSLDCRRCLREA